MLSEACLQPTLFGGCLCRCTHWATVQAWTGVWGVCKQQGGEVASRALTQMQVVQAKREEQGRHCHLEPVGEVATYGGGGQGMAPLTSPLCFSGCSSRLVFGMLYPAYASYKAVKTKNIREYVSGGWLRWGGMTALVGGWEVGMVGLEEGGESLNWPPPPPGAYMADRS